MSLGKGALLAGVSSLALFTWPIVAGETSREAKENIAVPGAKENITTPTKDTRPSAGSESGEPLIEQLDSADYDTREQACTKLAAKGKAAIAALEKASANGDFEVSSRATAVLGKLLKSSDEATQKAANEALQRLADGGSPAAARKARSILDNKNGLKNNSPSIVSRRSMVRIRPARALIPVPAVQGVAAPPSNNSQIEVATVTRLTKDLASRLEQLQKAGDCKNVSPESKAELRKQIDELSKRIEGLRGQLGDK